MTTDLIKLSSLEVAKMQLQQYSDQIDLVVKIAGSVQVSSKQTAQDALTLASDAKSLYKVIEAVRKKITEPARKYAASINDLARGFTDRLKQAEDHIKSKIEDWTRSEQLEDIPIDLMLLDGDISKIRSDNATAYTKTNWSFEITDVSKVPREFLKVDEEKVKLALKSGIRQIPGLTIVSEDKMIIRSR